MKYDFDTPVNRFNTDSYKWDVKENELPMWVADMDFKTAPAIIETIKKRAEHGIFGYSYVPDAWYDAYINWWDRRHSFKMSKNGLIFTDGVIPALSSAVRKLTTPNENVVIQTPVYNMFFNSVVNNGARILENPLIYENGRYSVDWEDLEKKLKDPQTTLMIVCNPHNPVGKIWDKETLIRIGELCAANDVTVISDEIHCDVVRPGTGYIPFASASELNADISVTLIAPTKCFNLAGINTAAVYASNRRLYHKMFRALNTDEVAEPNAFACPVAITAFNECSDWLDEMNEYVYANRDYAEEFIKKNIPSLSVVPGDATYLIWIDISETRSSSDAFADYLRGVTGLFITSGRHYGACGGSFIRMNLACPRTVLTDGLNRLREGTESFLNRKL